MFSKINNYISSPEKEASSSFSTYFHKGYRWIKENTLELGIHVMGLAAMEYCYRATTNPLIDRDLEEKMPSDYRILKLTERILFQGVLIPLYLGRVVTKLNPYWVPYLPSFLRPTLPHVTYERVYDETVIKTMVIEKDSKLQKKLNQIFEGIDNTLKTFSFSEQGKLPTPDEISSKLEASHPLKKAHWITSTIFYLNDRLKKYIFKICQFDNVGRFGMARGLRRLIEEKKLNKLYVPQKTLALLPESCLDAVFKGKGEAFQKRRQRYQYIVAAEKLDLYKTNEIEDYVKTLSDEEQKVILHQIFTLIGDSGYFDVRRENIVPIKSGENQGKWAIVDTEPHGLIEEMEEYVNESHLGKARDLQLRKALRGMGRSFSFKGEILEEVREIHSAKVQNELNHNARKRMFIHFAPTILMITPLVLTILGII